MSTLVLFTGAVIFTRWYLGRSHSAEKHVRILLAMETFKSLHTQDKSERLTAAEHHLSSTWYAGEVAEKSFNTSLLSDSSERNKVWNFNSSVLVTVGYAGGDDFWCTIRCSTVDSCTNVSPGSFGNVPLFSM